MAEVVLDNLSFRYPGAADPTLENLSLTVGDGAAHALLGGSGTGKTTLLNLLSGLLQPTAGRVLFDGADVSRLRGRDRGVAQVFQFPVCYDGMSVVDNLCFPLTSHGMRKRDARGRAVQMAQRLGLESQLNASAMRLPLFEKQLLAIGRALVRPDLALVLLDEPLTAVEPKIKWRLRTLLKTIQTETGVTMLYVTHDQTEALTFADQVSLMQGGRLLQTGAPQTLHDDPEHAYVAHFIGSPGMNLLPATVTGTRLYCGGAELPNPGLPDAADYQLGFRADWAELATPGAAAEPALLHGKLHSLRPLGVVQGEPQVKCQIRLGDELATLTGRVPADVPAGATVRIRLMRWVLFRNEQRLRDVAGS